MAWSVIRQTHGIRNKSLSNNDLMRVKYFHLSILTINRNFEVEINAYFTFTCRGIIIINCGFIDDFIDDKSRPNTHWAILSGYLHNLMIGFEGLCKGPKKATIVSPVNGHLLNATTQQILLTTDHVQGEREWQLPNSRIATSGCSTCRTGFDAPVM